MPLGKESQPAPRPRSEHRWKGGDNINKPTKGSLPIRLRLSALRATALLLEQAIRLNYAHVKLFVRLLLSVYRRINVLDKTLQGSSEQ